MKQFPYKLQYLELNLSSNVLCKNLDNMRYFGEGVKFLHDGL